MDYRRLGRSESACRRADNIRAHTGDLRNFFRRVCLKLGLQVRKYRRDLDRAIHRFDSPLAFQRRLQLTELQRTVRMHRLH